MSNLDVMRARLEEIETEFRTIHEAAGAEALNADQQTRWDELDTEHTEQERAIKDAEETELRAQRVAESRAKWGSVQVSQSVGAGSPFDGLDAVRSESEFRSRALKAVEETRYEGMGITEAAREAAASKIESVRGAAEYALAHGSPEYMSAFRSWLTSGGQPVYTAAEADAVRASMSLTSANGGYALPTLLDPTLIQTGSITKNPLRGISRVVTGTQNVWHGVSVSNVTTAWKAESSAFTDGSPTTGPVSVTANALTAYVTASYEIFQDSDMQAQLPGLIGQAIDMAEGVAFVSGSGSGQPLGIITAVSGTSTSVVTAGTRGAFAVADTLALYNSLPSRYEDSATWVANKATFVAIQGQTVGTAGTLLTEMVASNSLLQSPIVRASSVTATTTSGNFIAVLGDFSQFVVYDRIGVNLEFIQNVTNASGVPTGQRGLVAFKRVGSGVTDLDAFRLLKA